MIYLTLNLDLIMSATLEKVNLMGTLNTYIVDLIFPHRHYCWYFLAKMAFIYDVFLVCSQVLSILDNECIC